MGRIVNRIKTLCAHPTCCTRGSFGIPGESTRWCKVHSPAGATDLYNKRCAHPGCSTRPSYGFDGVHMTFCASHKLAGMIDDRSRRCKHPKCTRRPIYSLPGTLPEVCSHHRTAGDVNTSRTGCTYPGPSGCDSRPSFGFSGKKRCRCAAHREPGMVSEISAMCRALGCSKRSSYGHPGSKHKYCAAHREVDMVDLRSGSRSDRPPRNVEAAAPSIKPAAATPEPNFGLCMDCPYDAVIYDNGSDRCSACMLSRPVHICEDVFLDLESPLLWRWS